MVGKVSERVLLREGTYTLLPLAAHPSMCDRRIWTDSFRALEGLERTDNGMKHTNWPEVTPINQKNYYTYVVAAGTDGARQPVLTRDCVGTT